MRCNDDDCGRHCVRVLLSLSLTHFTLSSFCCLCMYVVGNQNSHLLMISDHS